MQPEPKPLDPTEPTPPRPPGRLRPSRRAAVAAAAIAGAALMGGGVGAVTALGLSEDSVSTTTVVNTGEAVPEATPAAASIGLSVGEVYAAVSEGVVEITVTSSGGSMQTPFGQDAAPSTAQGSGFVFDEQGRIVTNQHVVDGADSIKVTLADGSSYDARLLGSDASTDLALLEIDASEDVLEPLELGDSDALAVGDAVVAIGSPYGLEATVTSGIVSAVDRQITAPDGFAIESAIQTDAAINQGNSGGPLLNASADVVGVNSQIESDSGGNVGIGFAVPSNTVRSVVADILDDGSVEHPYLGVSLQTIPADVAEQLDGTAGVAVTSVREGSPAERAELRAPGDSKTVGSVDYPTGGDVIAAVDGGEIESAEDLQALISDHAPGDEIKLTVVRSGETRSVTVELSARPQ